MSHAISAGGVIPMLRGGAVLLPMVTTMGGRVSFPKGHLEDGETEESAALREVFEETGLMGLTIVRKLGVITRLGTEHDGSKKQKDIHLFLMRASDVVFDHEDDFVWVPLDSLGALLHKKEEADFLSAYLDEIRAAAPPQFAKLDQAPVWDALHRLPPADDEAKHYQIVPRYGGSVLQVGIGNCLETKELLSVEGVRVTAIDISSAAVIKLRSSLTMTSALEIINKDVHDLLADDLPPVIDLFIARGSLNLSDTKTFYLLNEIVRKMPIGGLILIEGATAAGVEAQGVTSVGQNVVMTADGRLLRVWNEAFVDDALVGRLRLEKLLVEFDANGSLFRCVLRKCVDFAF